MDKTGARPHVEPAEAALVVRPSDVTWDATLRSEARLRLTEVDVAFDDEDGEVRPG